MSKIKSDSIVTLHHQIGYTDGSILEDTFDSEPMQIEMGSGDLAQGLEMALLDLEAGDEQTLDIPPDLAFGFTDPENIHQIDRGEFNSELKLFKGLIIEFSLPSGEAVPGTILEFDDKSVKVDFNHPLAGHTVRYRVKIIAVVEASHQQGLQ